MISLLKIGLESVSDISSDLARSTLHVLDLKLEFRHVNVEFFQVISDILDLFLDIVFLMI